MPLAKQVLKTLTRLQGAPVGHPTFKNVTRIRRQLLELSANFAQNCLTLQWQKFRLKVCVRIVVRIAIKM